MAEIDRRDGLSLQVGAWARGSLNMRSESERPQISVGILTISTRASRGEYEDQSGPLLVELINGRHADWTIAHQEIVADDVAAIAATLRAWSGQGVNLILTNGGTGLSPYDVTPEATRQVIEREAPGIAEALRSESLKITRHAMLSRGVAGIHGRSLIINLPGNPKAVKESMDILSPVLPHAIDLLTEAPDTESDHRTV